MMVGYHCHSISFSFDHYSSSVVRWLLWIGIADIDLMGLTAAVAVVVEAMRYVHRSNFLLLDEL
jgi:hypothetical protein